MSSSSTEARTDSSGTGDDAAGPGAGLADVLMPQMGTSVAEGTIVAWKVAVGDAVVRDQLLCEVSTDKVDVECPAAEDGVLAEILVEAGETVDVGTAIARLRRVGGGPEGDAGAHDRPGAAATDRGGVDDTDDRPRHPEDGRGGVAPSAPASGTGAPAGTDSSRPAPAAADDEPADARAARRDALRRSSPVAARLAAEHGVDVHAVAGSGRNGRVTKRDVLAAAEASPSAGTSPASGAPDEAPMHTESPYRPDPSIPTAGSPADRRPKAAGSADGRASADPRADRSPAAASPAPDATPLAPPVVPADLGGEAVPATRMRRSIGDAVRRSLDTAAHCTTIVECDMSRVERARRELGVTALPLLARAAIETLQAFPALNATFDGETATRHGERVHLGIAVSLGEDGLIAPVIHDAQDLSVQGLARRIRDLAARARAGALSPDEVRGGTFTITNPGAAGALMATPVINLPQVAILDLEAIVRRPVVVTDPDGGESIGIRPMVHLCMGWDHRALDGLYAAQFLTALRGRVEG